MGKSYLGSLSLKEMGERYLGRLSLICGWAKVTLVAGRHFLSGSPLLLSTGQCSWSVLPWIHLSGLGWSVNLRYVCRALFLRSITRDTFTKYYLRYSLPRIYLRYVYEILPEVFPARNANLLQPKPPSWASHGPILMLALWNKGHG